MRCPLPLLLIGLAPLAAPAETLTTTWAPRTEQEAEALRGLLILHALRHDGRSRASVRQSGRDNLAGLSQSGRANLGVIRQRGEGHSATLDQSGDGNAHLLLQAGRGAEAEVAQTGDQIGITLQFGW